MSLKGSKNKNTYWNCLCECGNNTIVSTCNLRTKRTNSCGCIKNLVSQNKLLEIIKTIFPNKIIKSEYKEFDWLKNEKKLEIDIYLPELKLAIEFDGKQHFEPVCFGGISVDEAKERLKIQKKRDKIKNKKIANNKQYIKHFVRISYKEKLTLKNIKNILKSNGIRFCQDK